VPQSIGSKRLANLRLRQLDKQLDSLRRLAAVRRPDGGWIRTIRTALGMPLTYVAGRLGHIRQAVQQLEQREAEDRITLGALRGVADALDCDLVYALVPRRPLAQMLEREAYAMADREIRSVAHSMRLEQQNVPENEIKAQIKDRAAEILAAWPGRFWSRPTSPPRSHGSADDGDAIAVT
jgi:predicted DNA-binding mobile mystery protein A